jgi:MFS family permease
LHKPFYGWVIVGVSFLIGFTESGVFQNILSIFMKPMVDEFGWSRASVTGAIAFGSVCGGLLSLAIGPILDRYGPRMVSFCGIFFLSLGLGALMYVQHIWQLYLFFGAGRMIAVGALSLVTSVSIANWFVHYRGRAMGIKGIGERLGGALLPLMVQFLILYLGWRMAWGVLGGVVFLMSGIPALVLLRHRPEDMGLLPDGASFPSEKKGTDDSSREEEGAGDGHEPVWTRAQSTRTRAFWTLTLLSCLIPFLQAGINFHIYPFLTDQGFSQTTAVLILTTMAVSGMAGSVAWGMLTERFHIQNTMAANVIGGGLIFLALYWAVHFKIGDPLGTGIVFVMAALHGLFHGGRNPMLSVIWANFFGRRSMGSIYSLVNPFYFTANAIGPIFAGFCFDLSGSYAFPFYFFVVIFFISGMVSMRMRPPGDPGMDVTSAAAGRVASTPAVRKS